MRQADQIKRIEIQDAGDGSTTVIIKFFDGSEHYVNADTSPDGTAVSTRDRPGQTMSYPEINWDV